MKKIKRAVINLILDYGILAAIATLFYIGKQQGLIGLAITAIVLLEGLALMVLLYTLKNTKKYKLGDS